MRYLTIGGLLMTSDEALGSRIRRLRREQGFTVGNLAEKVGVSRPTIWSWEKGKTRPRQQKLEALAEVLNIVDAELILNEREVQQRNAARILKGEIVSAKERIAKLAGTAPEQVEIFIRH